MRSITLVAALTVAASAQSADHLLLTEFVVTPTNGEFVEIYNPTESDVSLDDYYLTDAVNGNDNEYVHLVDGSASISRYDFLAAFPLGSTLGAGEFAVVSIVDDSLFGIEYPGVTPDFEMEDASGGTDGVADMVDLDGAWIGTSAGLTNSGEMLALVHWDGVADLVSDVDYLVWGDQAEAVDKTGIVKDGPDPDSLATAYLDDIPVGLQTVVNADGGSDQPHGFGFSASRTWPFEEVGEIAGGGNGLTGNDETSEDQGASGNWTGHEAPTPGSVRVDAAPIINTLAVAPCIPAAGEAVTVSAQVIDDNLASVLALYSADGGASFDTTSMSEGDPGVYSASLGSYPPGIEIDLKVVAEDEGGNTTQSPASGPLAGFVVDTFTDITAIQSDTTAGGASAYVDMRVNVAGRVTLGSDALSDLYFYIASSDVAARWGGIKIFAPAGPTFVSEGDWVEIGGIVEEYYDETEIHVSEAIEDSVDCVNVIAGDPADVSALAVVSGSVDSNESLEGVLIFVNDSAAADTLNEYGEWLTGDGTGTCMVTSRSGHGHVPVVGNSEDVTGVVSYTFGRFKVQPRDGGDLDEVGFRLELVQVDQSAGPGDTFTEVVRITNGTAGTVAFDAADLEYSGPVSGAAPIFRGNASFPSNFVYEGSTTLGLPSGVPGGVYDQTTTIYSDTILVAADGSTVDVDATGAVVTIPVRGVGSPPRKVSGATTVDWDVSVRNTSGGEQVMNTLSASVERWSRVAGGWTQVDLLSLAENVTLAAGEIGDYSGSVTLDPGDAPAMIRVNMGTDFQSGIGAQLPSFELRHDP